MRIDIFEQDKASIQYLEKIIAGISIRENIQIESQWYYGPEAVQGRINIPGITAIALINMKLPCAEEISRHLYSRHRDCRQLIYGLGCGSIPHWIPYGPTGYSESLSGIENVLIGLVREVVSDTSWFHFINRRESIHIPASELAYFQSDLRYISVFTIDGSEARIIGKLDDLGIDAFGTMFLRIHKSYLVNTGCIRQIDKVNHTVQLATGQCLPISQNCYSSVRDWENLFKMTV